MVKTFDFKENGLVGVISDTHGYVSASVLKAFADTDLIIHAGDIGKPEVLKSLKSIAPLIAVRGNMDFGTWANQLRQHEIVHIGPFVIYVVHDVHRLRIDHDSAAANAVIFGHSHRALTRKKDDVLFMNPGSASYPKFGVSATVALLHLQGKDLVPKFIHLAD